MFGLKRSHHRRLRSTPDDALNRRGVAAEARPRGTAHPRAVDASCDESWAPQAMGTIGRYALTSAR